MTACTEAEAKTKWCPFVRYISGHDATASNRWKQSLPEGEPHALNPVPCRCIASACMVWRWDPEDNERAITKAKFDATGIMEIVKPEGDGWMDANNGFWGHEMRWHRPRRQRGYCGLAGKP